MEQWRGEQLADKEATETALHETYNLIQVSDRRYNVVKRTGSSTRYFNGIPIPTVTYKLVSPRALKWEEAWDLLRDMRG
jgi:hypothetical protein